MKTGFLSLFILLSSVWFSYMIHIFIYLFYLALFICILHIIICLSIQDDSRVIMSSTELKMQPTIHLQRKAG
jgi:hypothetical protein